jgi:hypothetical protein
MTRSRGLLGGLALSAALLLIPTAAAAEVRTGSVTDPTGDSPIPQTDITAVEFTYDTQGSMAVKATLAAAPDATTPATVGVRIGPMAGGTQCLGADPGPPAAGLSGGMLLRAPSGTGDAFITGGEDLTPPQVTIQGSTISATATDARIANKPWDCGVALTFGPGAPTASDATDPVALTAAPSPPPPPPPGAAPSCRIAKSKVRKGRPLAVRCTSVTGVVSARFKRRGSRARKVNARVDARGRGRFSTRKLRRGRYKVTVSQKGQRLGGRTVRVR